MSKYKFTVIRIDCKLLYNKQGKLEILNFLKGLKI